MEENSDILWKFQRYQILSESLSFCILPPPLNLVYYMIVIPIKMCLRVFKKGPKEEKNDEEDDDGKFQCKLFF